MDVDLSVEEELHLLSELSHTRGKLAVSVPPTLLPAAASAPSQYTEMLYVVLDTNVLISHLSFLVELKDFAIKGVGKPVLVIPWIVMQELDALKTTSSKVSVKAREAILFLHNCFSAGHPRVHGQTMEEVQTEVDNIAIENNDDRILHCCLLYQCKVSGHDGVVVLFSNDTQLCSKAMVNHVRALNRKTLLTELRVLCRSMQHAAPTSYTHTAEFSHRVSQHVKQEENKILVDDVLCEGESILRESLAVVVPVEMELAFDSLWSTVITVKPPWTLRDLLHILDKHWIAVFGQVIDRFYGQDSLKKLIQLSKSRHNKRPEDRDVQNFIAYSTTLLKAFPKRPRYKNVVAHSVASLNVLSIKLKEETSTPPKTTNVTPARTTPAQSLPAHLPPTPPLTPSPHGASPHGGVAHTESLLPLVTLSVAELGELTNSAPTLPEHQLPWLLNIILETTKHCLSRLARYMASYNPATHRSEAVSFISKLTMLLETMTASMLKLVQSPVELVTLREFRAALETFLLTCLQLSCPLSLEAMCQLVPQQLQLLAQAVGEFSSALDTLKLLAQQYALGTT